MQFWWTAFLSLCCLTWSISAKISDYFSLKQHVSLNIETRLWKHNDELFRAKLSCLKKIHFMSKSCMVTFFIYLLCPRQPCEIYIYFFFSDDILAVSGESLLDNLVITPLENCHAESSGMPLSWIFYPIATDWFFLDLCCFDFFFHKRKSQFLL